MSVEGVKAPQPVSQPQPKEVQRNDHDRDKRSHEAEKPHEQPRQSEANTKVHVKA